MYILKHANVLLFTLMVTVWISWTTPAGAVPDIIVILGDDLGASDIGPQRRKAGLLTPNIDAIGRAGITYTAGYAQPACVQSRTALLTGLWPQRRSVGAVINNGPQPPSSIVTIAERLRALGYTNHLVGKWHLGFNSGKHPLDQGFDTFDALAERRFAPFRIHDPLVWRVAKNRYFPARWFVRWVDEYRGLAGVLDAAVHWGEQRAERERPFFLFLVSLVCRPIFVPRFLLFLFRLLLGHTLLLVFFLFLWLFSLLLLVSVFFLFLVSLLVFILLIFLVRFFLLIFFSVACLLLLFLLLLLALQGLFVETLHQQHIGGIMHSGLRTDQNLHALHHVAWVGAAVGDQHVESGLLGVIQR